MLSFWLARTVIIVIQYLIVIQFQHCIITEYLNKMFSLAMQHDIILEFSELFHDISCRRKGWLRGVRRGGGPCFY